MQIAFIAIGNMGLPMATNLIQAGHSLTVWNRTPQKAEPLVKLGATLARTPQETLESSSVVITMLANDAALEQVVCGKDGFGEKLGRDGIHISMSTISPETSDKLAQYHRARSAVYIAANVLGRPDAAAARKLFILCAGAAETKAKIAPVLEAMGQRVFDIGEEPSHANIIKLSGNFMIMAAIESMAEAFTLCEKHGVPREKTLEVLTQSLFSAPLFVNYGKQIASNTYQPAGFKLSLGFKDATLVSTAANRALVPMPLAALMLLRFQAGMAKGWKDLDWAATALNVSQDAGVWKG